MSKQLLLRRGMTGQVLFGSGKRSKWYRAIIEQIPPDGSGMIKIGYVNNPRECGLVHEDELHCLDCGGEAKMYIGMVTKCRGIKEQGIVVEESEVNGLDLAAYKPGKITAIVDGCGDEEQEIEFEFFGKPSRKASAKPTDLLYWGVPEGTDIESGEIEENISDGEEVILRRKRRAVATFDPTPRTYKSYRRIIEDSEDSNDGDSGKTGGGGRDDDSFDKELFPDSDGEEGGGMAMAQDVTNQNRSDEAPQPSKKSGSWGNVAQSHSSQTGGWGVHATSSATDSSSGWGTNIVTPTKSHSGSWGSRGNSGSCDNDAQFHSSRSGSVGWGLKSPEGSGEEWGSNIASAGTGNGSIWGGASRKGNCGGWGHTPVTPSRSPSKSPGGNGGRWNSRSSSTGAGDGDCRQKTSLHVTAAGGDEKWGCSTQSTSLRWGAVSTPAATMSPMQFRQPSKRCGKRRESRHAIKSSGTLEVYREATDEFLLRYYFGGRIKVIETVARCSSDSLEKKCIIGGEECVLIASKFEKASDTKSFKYSGMCNKLAGAHMKAFYLASNKSNYGPLDAQKELDQIANFSELALTPGKLRSRLELLVSPAAKHPQTKAPFMFKMNLSYFEETSTPQNATMGCGFIPSDMLEELLGSRSLGRCRWAKDISVVQLRIMSPHLGLYKGEFIKTQGIKKIMLPSSMKKVGAAQKPPRRNTSVLMLFNSVSPSVSSAEFERVLNPRIQCKPTKSALADLKSIDRMAERALLGCDVPAKMLADYAEWSCSWDGRAHHSLRGACDCTRGGLPEGTVFIPSSGIRGHVAVTRSPCTEAGDFKVLPVVTEKPEEMSSADWEHICGMSFGIIVFASPKDPKAKSMPELVNDSDLDGDHFLVIWEPTIVECVKRHADIAQSVRDSSEIEQGEDKVDKGEEVDDLLATRFPLEVEGKMCNAVVVSKTNGGKYLVKSGHHEEEMTRDDIMKGRCSIKKVTGHHGRGRNAKLEVEWENGPRSWLGFSQVKEEVPHLVAQHALDNDLMNEPGWGWTKDYIHDAEIVEVRNHRLKGKSLELEVFYDGDSEPDWVKAKTVDVDVLAKFVEAKNISLKKVEWKWLDEAIKKAQKRWFMLAQDELVNVKKLAEIDKLVKDLCSLYTKSSGADSLAYGRAYKEALKVAKHGGRVPLPAHLHDVVAGKKLHHLSKHLKCLT